MADTAVPPKQLKTCARPGCPVTFTPRTKDHKYCSARCKKTVTAYRHALGSGGR
jgi:predicted nucleic acid-binding Zn ribbon protein